MRMLGFDRDLVFGKTEEYIFLCADCKLWAAILLICRPGKHGRTRRHPISYRKGKIMNNSQNTLALIGGFGLGAAAMYMFDPDRGRRRRAVVVDKLSRSLNQLGDAADVAGRDLINRTRGIAAESLGLLRADHALDVVLEGRVRSK